MKNLIFLITFFALIISFTFGQTTFSYKSSSVEYVSGYSALIKFIQANMILPDSVKNGLIGGVVFLKLDIDSFGFITKSQILKGIKSCSQCDKEALRLLSILPKPAFNPQIIDNARVPSTFNLPIKFELKEDSLFKYTDGSVVGKWTFRDQNYKKCADCPEIVFNSDHTAQLLSDKISWKLANNKLTISDLGKSSRSAEFLPVGSYKVIFSNYLQFLKLTGQKYSYTLTRE